VSRLLLGGCFLLGQKVPGIEDVLLLWEAAVPETLIQLPAMTCHSPKFVASTLNERAAPPEKGRTPEFHLLNQSGQACIDDSTRFSITIPFMQRFVVATHIREIRSWS